MLPHKKLPKVKKTLDELLHDGQLKTGKTILSEKDQQERDLAVFTEAAVEEERMRRYQK